MGESNWYIIKEYWNNQLDVGDEFTSSDLFESLGNCTHVSNKENANDLRNSMYGFLSSAQKKGLATASKLNDKGRIINVYKKLKDNTSKNMPRRGNKKPIRKSEAIVEKPIQIPTKQDEVTTSDIGESVINLIDKLKKELKRKDQVLSERAIEIRDLTNTVKHLDDALKKCQMRILELNNEASKKQGKTIKLSDLQAIVGK